MWCFNLATGTNQPELLTGLAGGVIHTAKFDICGGDIGHLLARNCGCGIEGTHALWMMTLAR